MARPQFVDLNRLDGQRGRQVWHNFWDTCILSETGYWTHFNYIHYNPVKHGYVPDPADWVHSSFSRMVALGLYPPECGYWEPEHLKGMDLE